LEFWRTVFIRSEVSERFHFYRERVVSAYDYICSSASVPSNYVRDSFTSKTHIHFFSPSDVQLSNVQQQLSHRLLSLQHPLLVTMVPFPCMKSVRFANSVIETEETREKSGFERRKERKQRKVSWCHSSTVELAARSHSQQKYPCRWASHQST